MEESDSLGLHFTEEEITLCKFLEVKQELLDSTSSMWLLFTMII